MHVRAVPGGWAYCVNRGLAKERARLATPAVMTTPSDDQRARVAADRRGFEAEGACRLRRTDLTNLRTPSSTVVDWVMHDVRTFRWSVGWSLDASRHHRLCLVCCRAPEVAGPAHLGGGQVEDRRRTRTGVPAAPARRWSAHRTSRPAPWRLLLFQRGAAALVSSRNRWSRRSCSSVSDIGRSRADALGAQLVDTACAAEVYCAA